MTPMLLLALLFSKFAMLCFGGGYMLIPMIVADCVERYHYLGKEQFANLLAIAQLTPGPVGINTATYVGFIQQHFWGSLLTTLALILPTFILSCLACWSIQQWKDQFFVAGILRGTRLSAQALICYAVSVFMGLSIFTTDIPWQILRGGAIPDNFDIRLPSLILTILAATAIARKWCSTTLVILGSAILGAICAILQ